MKLELTDTPRKSELERLETHINAYNIARVGADDFRPLALFVRDDAGELAAGLSGYTWAGFCEIQFLWVAEALRGRGHGRRLLGAAEGEAGTRGCRVVLLHSYSFQAPEFYRKLGYEEVGRADDCPPGEAHFYFSKRL